MMTKRTNQLLTAALLAAVFAGVLILNGLTPYVADDYSYLIHFGTKEPIRSLKDVAESMYIHSLKMNGRVVSHSIAQIFSMAPKGFYNLCNAAVYTALMYLLYRIANFRKKENPLLLASICMAFFAFMPVFGQVCLWYVGSVNYLWALFFGLLFVLPYLRRFLGGKDCFRGPFYVLMCIGALLFGMYSEITSFVGICLAFGLMAVPALLRRQPWKTGLWVHWAMACVGYLILLSIPAERNAKQAGGLGPELLLQNISRATDMLLEHCGLLLVIFAALFLFSLLRRTEPDRLIISGLLFLGAVGANYMTVVAAYYPQRCLATTVMLLILGIAMLAAPLGTGKATGFAGVLLACFFLFQAYFGVSDIYGCWKAFKLREAVILEAAQLQEELVYADIVTAQTPYSAFWELRDLSTEDPETWPNFAMGKIYGIKILGIDSIE